MRAALGRAGAVLLAVLTIALSPARGDGALPATIAAAMLRHHLAPDTISIHVVDPARGAVVLSHLADRARNPASAMKLVTTYAALDLLGPEFTWHTKFFAGGPLEAGVLRGDLHIQGGGDPMVLVEDLLRTLFLLRQLGLREITGDLVVDDGYFDGTTIDTAPIDADPYRAYNAYPGSTVLNFRATRFLFLPRDGRVDIVADPPASTLSIDNRLTATGGACRGAHRAITMHVDRARAGTSVRFSGRYPESCGESEMTRTVLEQDAYVVGVFSELWSRLGGTFQGRLRYDHVPADAAPLFDHASRPLSEVIRAVNKFSNNQMARALLLTLGAETYGPPGTVEAGKAAVGSWLNGRGIAMPELNMDNGAGLSRDARLTARGLAALLENVLRHPYRDEFLSSLSLVGVDGSARRRRSGGFEAGHYRLKTGLLDGVRAAAGYGLTARGTRLVIVIIQNAANLGYANGNAVQDAVLSYLHHNH